MTQKLYNHFHDQVKVRKLSLTFNFAHIFFHGTQSSYGERL